jgi:hypothetical protein
VYQENKRTRRPWHGQTFTRTRVSETCAGDAGKLNGNSERAASRVASRSSRNGNSFFKCWIDSSLFVHTRCEVVASRHTAQNRYSNCHTVTSFVFKKD